MFATVSQVIKEEMLNKKKRKGNNSRYQLKWFAFVKGYLFPGTWQSEHPHVAVTIAYMKIISSKDDIAYVTAWITSLKWANRRCADI